MSKSVFTLPELENIAEDLILINPDEISNYSLTKGIPSKVKSEDFISIFNIADGTIGHLICCLIGYDSYKGYFTLVWSPSFKYLIKIDSKLNFMIYQSYRSKTKIKLDTLSSSNLGEMLYEINLEGLPFTVNSTLNTYDQMMEIGYSKEEYQIIMGYVEEFIKYAFY